MPSHLLESVKQFVEFIELSAEKGCQKHVSFPYRRVICELCLFESWATDFYILVVWNKGKIPQTFHFSLQHSLFILLPFLSLQDIDPERWVRKQKENSVAELGRIYSSESGRKLGNYRSWSVDEVYSLIASLSTQSHRRIFWLVLLFVASNPAVTHRNLGDGVSVSTVNSN